MAGEEGEAARHCEEMVRAADKDHFLSSLFAPATGRRRLFALYAFNIELARLRERVSEPRLGEIRLQWWLEALDGVYGGAAPAHPVVDELARTIEHADLPKFAFVHMIEARRFDLYDDPMPSLADLEGYLGETACALIRLSSLALAGEDALPAATAAGYAGVAQGLTGLLRLLPLHRARSQCYLPADMLERRDLTPAHVLSGRFDAGLEVVIAELAHHVRRRLDEARARQADVPAAALPAFLPVSLVDLYLKKIVHRGFNPLKRVAEVSQLARQWRLWRMARAETF
jgi:phytoene synthase